MNIYRKSFGSFIPPVCMYIRIHICSSHYHAEIKERKTNPRLAVRNSEIQHTLEFFFRRLPPLQGDENINIPVAARARGLLISGIFTYTGSVHAPCNLADSSELVINYI